MSTGKQIGPASEGTTCRDLQRRHGGGRGTIRYVKYPGGKEHS